MAHALVYCVLLALAQQATSRNVPSIGDSSVNRQAGLGEPIPSRYVVVFKKEAGDIASATDRLVQHVNKLQAPVLRGVAASTSSSSSSAFKVVRSLRNSPGADASVRTAAAHSRMSRGMQGIVVEAPAAVAAHIKQSDGVSAVFQDRVIGAQVDTCVEAQHLSQGSITTASTVDPSTFKWRRCHTNRTKLAWIGRRCSDMSSIEYTAVYAVDKTTGLIKRIDGQECVLMPDPVNRTATWNKRRFGSCGIAPAFAADLPTTVCSGTGGESSCVGSRAAAEGEASTLAASVTLNSEVVCDTELVQQLTYTGTPCGPNNQFVQWTQASTASGCTITPSSDPAQTRFNADVFGSCGVPPGKAAHAMPSVLCTPQVTAPLEASPLPDLPIAEPSPPPSPPPVNPIARLPRVPVAAGEQVPPGVARIEAATAEGVVNTAGLLLEQQVVVGVVDSGVDATHPDLNIVGAESWVGEDDDDGGGIDLFGHGTHVSGIVGAKNNGQYVVGVSPGVPIFSLKVLDSQGKGSLSNMIAAVQWAITEGKAKGINVINLSVAAYIDPSSPDFPAVYDVVCNIFKDASDAGAVVTVAAGNYGASMAKGYFPASCPGVAAVTALNTEGTEPAAYSNWLPADASDEEKARVIAAPGSSVLSTMSFAKDSTGYKVLSGTSMASPHVAGLAATCIMSGACAAGTTGAQKLAVIQAAAKERLSRTDVPPFGFKGDAASPINGKYFGLLAWSAF